MHGEGAHDIDHRRSLRIVEAQGHVPLRTNAWTAIVASGKSRVVQGEIPPVIYNNSPL